MKPDPFLLICGLLFPALALLVGWLIASTSVMV